MTDKFGRNRYRVICHKYRKNISLAVGNRGEKKYGRWKRTKEALCRRQEEVTDTSISERKILVRSFQNFALKIHEEAFVCCVNIVSEEKWHRSPRIASFLSGGMPLHKGLFPSTMLLHSSLASWSETVVGKRYARRVRSASSGECGGAGGIRRMSRERISPEQHINIIE